jgi:hypothetical protein
MLKILIKNCSPEAVAKIAELLIGGLSVLSERERYGGREIYAKTLVQLDGDVVTVFREDAVAGSDFGDLSRQHFKDVTSALAPLASFSAWLDRTTRYGPIIGVILGGSTGCGSIYQSGLPKLFLHIGTLGSAAMVVVCLSARWSFGLITRWWGSRLMKQARAQDQQYYERQSKI